MTVEAVVGKIDLASDEPLGPGAIPFENFVPFLEPVEFGGNFAPKLVGIIDRLLIEALVLGESFDVSVAAEFGGRVEAALLLEDGVDATGLEIG